MDDPETEFIPVSVEESFNKNEIYRIYFRQALMNIILREVYRFNDYVENFADLRNAQAKDLPGRFPLSKLSLGEAVQIKQLVHCEDNDYQNFVNKVKEVSSGKSSLTQDMISEADKKALLENANTAGLINEIDRKRGKS